MSRLTESDLARMRAEHAHDDYTGPMGFFTNGTCLSCCVGWPCDAASLLAQFAPGPVPHLAGVAYGLMGPRDESELTSAT